MTSFRIPLVLQDWNSRSKGQVDFFLRIFVADWKRQWPSFLCGHLEIKATLKIRQMTFISSVVQKLKIFDRIQNYFLAPKINICKNCNSLGVKIQMRLFGIFFTWCVVLEKIWRHFLPYSHQELNGTGDENKASSEWHFF